MFTSLATDHRRPGRAAPRHPRDDDRRQGRARGRRCQHAARAGWSSPARTRSTWRRGMYSGWKLADTHRPIHNVIISNVPGPAVPALLRRCRDARRLPVRSDHGGRRAEHHGVQLPRLHRHRVQGRARAGPRPVGHGRRGRRRRSPSSSRPHGPARCDHRHRRAPRRRRRRPRTVPATSTNGATRRPPDRHDRQVDRGKQQTSTNGAKTSRPGRTTKPATSTATTAKKRTPTKRTTRERRSKKRSPDAA